MVMVSAGRNPTSLQPSGKEMAPSGKIWMRHPKRGWILIDNPNPQVYGRGANDLAAIDTEIAQLEQELESLGPVQAAQVPQQAQVMPQIPHGTDGTVPSQGQPLPPMSFGQPSVSQQFPTNPIFETIKEDVSRRVFANQAARGKLGSGGTPAALATALAPMQLQQQQQDISNLFNLLGLGANVASGQGTAGMGAASNIGNAMMAGGQAQAQGAMNRANAITGGLGSLAGFAGMGMFGGSGSPVSGFGLGGGLPFSPTTSSIPFTA